MARRINVVFTEIATSNSLNQLCNQEGRDITEMSGENHDKQVVNLIDRTCSRLYGPNSAFVLTGFKARGKGAGYQGFVAKRAWGKLNYLGEAKQVIVNLTLVEDGEIVHQVSPAASAAEAPKAAESTTTQG